MNGFYDVIVVGGSYSGLAATMALGRALKDVLVIDSGLPCNRQTPYSHNFITQDGRPPAAIAAVAKEQVRQYPTVSFLSDIVQEAKKTPTGFVIQTASGATYFGTRLLFATGIRDLLPPIDGLSECWGITVLHCPYCHGYEVRNQYTGIIGNGEQGFEMARLISNWTRDLTLFTNGPSSLTPEHKAMLSRNQIRIIETKIDHLEHANGIVSQIALTDNSKEPVKAIYIRSAFEQHCKIPESLGCELTEEGYLKIDALHETTVEGIYAAGDNVSRMRTVANAVAMGTAAGINISRKMIAEKF